MGACRSEVHLDPGTRLAFDYLAFVGTHRLYYDPSNGAARRLFYHRSQSRAVAQRLFARPTAYQYWQ